MGKAQSKRSVDITTEGKKDEEVVAGKVEKIEDAEDQKPQVNGDATPQEGEAKEKKENEESENDKDATTEKGSGDADGGGGGEASAAATQNGEQSAEEAAKVATTPKDKDEAKEGGEAAEGAEEAISPLADDSSKKTKKEKVKKKWSFRSISFGKKDKQKPAKTEGEATSPTTNGEAADKTVEGANGEEAKKDDGAEAGAKTTENGEASEKELLNGGGETTTTTPTDDKSNNAAATNESTNDTAATAAVATTNNTTASSSTTTSPSTAPVAGDVQTENKVAVTAADVVVTPVLSNGTTDDIKEIAEKPQQNGTNGEGHADDEEETHVADIKAASKSIECEKNIENELASGDGADTGANAGDGAGEGEGDGDGENAVQTTKVCIDLNTIAEDLGACGDVADMKQSDKMVEPPPLPVSPPPSQVVVFALNNELPASEALEHLLEDKLQSSIVPIAEEEEEFAEKPEEQTEIPIIKEEEEEAEATDLPQNETLPIAETEVEAEIVATAEATFLVDEITAKASNIVTEMTNVLHKQHEECVEELLKEDAAEEEDELPPPPPTPPSETAENEHVNDVEEVLNQFESKMNEIEKKVMSFEISSNDEEDEQISAYASFNEENVVIDEVNVAPMSVLDFIEKLENVEDAQSEKENDETAEKSTDIPAWVIDEVLQITEQYEQQQQEKEQEQEEEIQPEKQQEISNVEQQAAEVDVTAEIVDEINKLSLNEKVNEDELKTAEDCANDVHVDVDVDLKNVKEINPIELKEAAAAEIKTQELAVSCE